MDIISISTIVVYVIPYTSFVGSNRTLSAYKFNVRALQLQGLSALEPNSANLNEYYGVFVFRLMRFF